jgi:hypothetical protein
VACAECGYDGVEVIRCQPGSMLRQADGSWARCMETGGEHLHLTCRRCGAAHVVRPGLDWAAGRDATAVAGADGA